MRSDLVRRIKLSNRYYDILSWH